MKSRLLPEGTKLDKPELILLKVAQLSISDIPKTYTDLCKMIWSAFEAGKEYNKITTNKVKE